MGRVPQAIADSLAGRRIAVDGGPFMHGAPVDPFHGCMRWWLERTGGIRA
jgi:hypothetical protein